ncbi:TonB-dependent receptor [Croceitalea rosinachiae]|uniref:TonB-dependent receptor n=1 Tax=Croceitalea rosinachiae TaxID=3075596 RepID=A0ABU3A8K6_9FLAO|nr:TonB-dependent receptor [Croceitalea sp. F388]MDT0606501.1 TonB-dependent receptor [Croceitalea sp. F388]
MRLLLSFTCLLWTCFYCTAQQTQSVSGKVLNNQTKEILASVTIVIEGTIYNTQTNSVGAFKIDTDLQGDFVLNISKPDFSAQRLAISLDGNSIDLGTIFLEKDFTLEKSDNLITLTDGDLSDDDQSTSVSAGLLQATRDVFLNRAAFDFGQAFFRVRGYDSQNGQVLLNGIAMNKFFDGRPQWNNWGGLNDVIRNQEFSNGLEASSYTFGGILGNTNIDMRPSTLRPGTRLSSSISNRTYTGRLMTTYTAPVSEKGIAYTFSASRRWAKEGYLDGTLYDAYSFFGAFEYKPNEKHSFTLTSILARNRRGRSSAITEEVLELGGRKYNPYWGEQNGKIRNAREREIFEPIFMFNHYFKNKSLKLTSGISYQFGTNSRSRLGYFNAPNPDPTYYRYLPSFYINNPVGADFTNAALAREGFGENPQINWNNLYTSNSNIQNGGKASYILNDDTTNDSQLSISSIANININAKFNLDFGINYRSIASENYAQVNDLLGADFHEDIDPFSDTQNDINGNLNKTVGDIFNYHYDIKASRFSSFGQFRAAFNKWDGFIAISASNTNYQRIGLFQNERFLETSFGESEQIKFSDYGFKTGFAYKLTGRHWIKVNSAYISRPPTLQNVFINPRENNELVSNLQSEQISSADINYFIRLPDLTGRLTGFYTRFQNTTDINFFFVDAGLGSDFVQEAITDLDKLHMGIEMGLEYQASSSVKLSAVANIGKYVYASDPNVTINFDTAGAEEDLIDPEGNIDLGVAKIKDLKLAQGPQQAFALGIEYRDPKYWWVGATTNYLANNYANISTITRTQSFFLDPETGKTFPDATSENVENLLRQSKLDDFYLLNLVGGKSWLKNGTYISIFASINNAFDTVFRTGGYEQSRNGNFGQLQQDNLRNDPSFAPKYWYGFGRTYFLNFAISF